MITLKLTDEQYKDLLYACREAAFKEVERAVDFRQPNQGIFLKLADNIGEQVARQVQPDRITQPEGAQV